MRRAIVFYSFEGNTREAAEKIAGILEADLVEIKPVKEIPEFGPAKMMAGGGKALFGFESAVLPVETDLSTYDELILGTPVWAGRPNPYLMNFFKPTQFKEKVTAAFTLSASGNNKSCVKTLRKKFPNIRYDVSLSDRVGKGADNNEDRIGRFTRDILTPSDKELKE